MMSHELRTPLNAIGGYVQLMLDGIPNPATEGQLNYLRRILKSQNHLLSLIEAVLKWEQMPSAASAMTSLPAFRVTDRTAQLCS